MKGRPPFIRAPSAIIRPERIDPPHNIIKYVCFTIVRLLFFREQQSPWVRIALNAFQKLKRGEFCSLRRSRSRWSIILFLVFCLPSMLNLFFFFFWCFFFFALVDAKFTLISLSFLWIDIKYLRKLRKLKALKVYLFEGSKGIIYLFEGSKGIYLFKGSKGIYLFEGSKGILVRRLKGYTCSEAQRVYLFEGYLNALQVIIILWVCSTSFNPSIKVLVAWTFLITNPFLPASLWMDFNEMFIQGELFKCSKGVGLFEGVELMWVVIWFEGSKRS